MLVYAIYQHNILILKQRYKGLVVLFCMWSLVPQHHLLRILYCSQGDFDTVESSAPYKCEDLFLDSVYFVELYISFYILTEQSICFLMCFWHCCWISAEITHMRVCFWACCLLFWLVCISVFLCHIHLITPAMLYVLIPQGVTSLTFFLVFTFILAFWSVLRNYLILGFLNYFAKILLESLERLLWCVGCFGQYAKNLFKSSNAWTFYIFPYFVPYVLLFLNDLLFQCTNHWPLWVCS